MTSSSEVVIGKSTHRDFEECLSSPLLGGSFSGFFYNLFAPTCTVFGGRRIERVEPAADNTNAVWIKGLQRPLYLPAEFDLQFLHRVLAEETYSWNWHYYQVRQTRVERGDVVLDCGAAEGFFSLKAIEQGAGRVICIESHPICAHCG
jgi:hypothetical protein